MGACSLLGGDPRARPTLRRPGPLSSRYGPFTYGRSAAHSRRTLLRQVHAMPTLRRPVARALPCAAFALALATLPAPALAQQALDSAYTARIRELTPTDPRWVFSTSLVDHLPASATVPTPLQVLGYVPGTIGKLSRV